MKSKKSEEKKVEKLYDLFDGESQSIYGIHPPSISAAERSDGWEAWPDHSEEHDHDHGHDHGAHGGEKADADDVSMKGSSPEKPSAKASKATKGGKSEAVGEKQSKGKKDGQHHGHHHANGREKKARVVRAHS